MRFALALQAVALTTVLCGCLASDPSPTAPTEIASPPPSLSIDPAMARVRPGLGIVSPAMGTTALVPTFGYTCTAGFLMRSPGNGSVYLATAGHCIQHKGLGDRVIIGFDGSDIVAWGTVVYVSELVDPEARPESCLVFVDERRCFNDLGLVELDVASYATANASLPSWGGPSPGVAAGTPGDVVYTVGASSYRGGTGLPDARAGVLASSGQWSATAQFTTTTPAGDSGSPVLDAQGRPFGLVIARAVTAASPDPVVGLTYIALLAPLLAAAADHGWDLVVVDGGGFQGLGP